MPARGSAAHLLFVTLLLALLPTGCDEDTTCRPCATVTISGEITAVGNPVEAQVRAHQLPPQGQYGFILRAETETDSTGHYSLSVPAGRYVIRITSQDLGSGYFAHDGSLSYRQADTLSIDEGSDPVGIDVRVGAVRLLVEAPPEWDQSSVRASLHPANEDILPIQRYNTVENGGVEILFPAVVPGPYQALLLSDNDAGSVWLPPTYTQSDADWIEVGSEAETLYEAQIPSPGTITGKVLGSWQELLMARPEIHIFDASSTLITRRRVEHTGDFSHRIYAPMKVRILASISGIDSWYGGEGFEDATELDLQLGQQIDVEILESGIAGFLMGPGYRYADLYREDGSEVGRSTITGLEGIFRFSNLSPGTYFIHFESSRSWPTFWYDAADSIESASPIEITEEGELIWITPTPVEGGSISGRILDSDGEPVHTARFILTDSDDPSPNLRTELVGGTDGNFRISGLGNGTYKVGAEIGRYTTAWHPTTACWDSSAVITIEGWQDVTGITIQFPE